MEYGVYGDLTIIYPKPYSIYLMGTIYEDVTPNLENEVKTGTENKMDTPI